jgi:hypothetical protein
VNIPDNPKILFALKAALFVLISSFVIERLFFQNDIKTQFSFFTANLQTQRFYFFVAAILLMPLNWGIETFKWKILLQSKLALKVLLKSVIAGITVGFVTPGRSGEFVGRVMMLDDDKRTRVFYLSNMGGFAQTAASLVTGVPFVYLWSNNLFLTEMTTGFATAYLLLYFRFDWLTALISRVGFLQRHGLIMPREELPEINVQVWGLLLSFMRFFVYLSQYVLLLLFFGVNGGYLALTMHSVVFLLAQTFSPLMPLLDVSYRSGSALLIFKDLTGNNIAVLCAVTMVWFINLCIPALGGYFFIVKKNNFNIGRLSV